MPLRLGAFKAATAIAPTAFPEPPAEEAAVELPAEEEARVAALEAAAAAEEATDEDAAAAEGAREAAVGRCTLTQVDP